MKTFAVIAVALCLASCAAYRGGIASNSVRAGFEDESDGGKLFFIEDSTTFQGRKDK